ncbi:TonB-dependent receptor plug domain-containing protein [Pontibacter litorisediminis]|uniref:TonB-dependent receptor plug domain-containing protein n=1 Tax=Pontibacter litorisediminis TaxID=1846260 RepID=UPI0023EBADC6|nr:TonB-dependent receptor plug domain-containing protein [Pontibacter litorisediminis]
MAQTEAADSLQTGYGARKLSELTEAAEQLLPDRLNKGLISSPEQLLTGRIPGLRVVSNGGAPGAGATMVLRAGGSLTASTSPLVVLDGVPLSMHTASGHAGVLAFLNPADIASITLLKDDPLAAMYGGRAANGVLYITTKIGGTGEKVRLNYNTTAGISILRKKAPVLDAGRFRELVGELYPDQAHLLGEHNTDWQDVIFGKAFSHDQHLRMSGAILQAVPYSVSLGHLKENGILKESSNRRNSLAVSLNPSFWKHHLNLNLHFSNVNQKLLVADEKAITSAWAFDPTQPVHADNKYGGYFTYEKYATYAPNPLSMLEQRQDTDETRHLLGQAHLQYRLHFLPSLSINFRHAFQRQDNEFITFRPADMAAVPHNNGWVQRYTREQNWKQNELFLNLDHEVKSISSKLTITLGTLGKETELSRDDFSPFDVDGSIIMEHARESHYWEKIVSAGMFGNAAVSVKDKYSLSAAASRQEVSGFPAASPLLSGGVGGFWNISKEAFLKGNPWLSELRAYANYSRHANPDAIGSKTLRGERSTAETTSKWNAGLHGEVLQGKLQVNLNYYSSLTEDLLLYPLVSIATSRFRVPLNMGKYKASGVEASLGYVLKDAGSWRWEIGAHLTTIANEVVALVDGFSYVQYPDDMFALGLQKGSAAHAFYLFEQLYDEKGLPLPGKHKPNEYGHVVPRLSRSADPSALVGFSTDIRYKRIEASLLLNGALGHHVYNYANGITNYAAPNFDNGYLKNATESFVENEYRVLHSRTDHYLEKGAFLRLQYLNFSYDLGSAYHGQAHWKAMATVQNAFVLTKYSGQDPEVAGGIDYGQYPQPTTFSLGLGLQL